MNSPNNRRNFVKSCVATAAMVAANPTLLAESKPVNYYTRSLLTDQRGEPITSGFLAQGQAFVFHYPFVTTPCFIIDIGSEVKPVENLPTEKAGRYSWQGGSGPERSVVSFAAICAHKLSYPTKTISFLNYRAETVEFVDRDFTAQKRSQLIYCCSERSAYDPSQGAKVLGGPAKQPLTAIELEHDMDQDHYYAIGTRGGELYQQFFEKFGFRLALDHKIEDVAAIVDANTTVYPHSEYSKRAVSC